jgi:hypothetical protein
MPVAATLEAMAWWAAVGAGLGLGGWLFGWIAERGAAFGDARPADLPEVEVPGFKSPGEDERAWVTPRGALRLAVGGAVGGALMGWVIESPEGFDERLQLGLELAAVAVAAVVLVRTLDDIPAVGEAPPGDPDESHPVRIRNAVLKLMGAVFMFGLVSFGGRHFGQGWLFGAIALGAFGLLIAWWRWLNDPKPDPAVIELRQAEVPREAVAGFAAAIGVVAVLLAGLFWLF